MSRRSKEARRRIAQSSVAGGSEGRIAQLEHREGNELLEADEPAPDFSTADGVELSAGEQPISRKVSLPIRHALRVAVEKTAKALTATEEALDESCALAHALGCIRTDLYSMQNTASEFHHTVLGHIVRSQGGFGGLYNYSKMLDDMTLTLLSLSRKRPPNDLTLELASHQLGPDTWSSESKEDRGALNPYAAIVLHRSGSTVTRLKESLEDLRDLLEKGGYTEERHPEHYRFYSNVCTALQAMEKVVYPAFQDSGLIEASQRYSVHNMTER